VGFIAVISPLVKNMKILNKNMAAFTIDKAVHTIHTWNCV